MAKSTKKKNPKNVRAGKKSRRKGGVFERKVAKIVRATFPGVEIRRSTQSERAYNSDIFVDNGPELFKRIWWECNSSRNPQPAKKLEQAERDVKAFYEREGKTRLPVVIWHRIHSPYIHVRITVETLCILQGLYCARQEELDMRLEAFMSILKEYHEC